MLQTLRDSIAGERKEQCRVVQSEMGGPRSPGRWAGK